MALYITEDCVMCGACYYECPQGAICEGGNTYVIDQEKCTQCTICYEACKFGAIDIK